MKNQIILSSYSQQELRTEIIEAFREFYGKNPDQQYINTCAECIECVEQNEISVSKRKFKPKVQEFKEKYLTRGEVAQFLKISLPTLHRYTKDSVLKSYRIGGKVRYKLQEVEESLKLRNFGLPQRGGSHA